MSTASSNESYRDNADSDIDQEHLRPLSINATKEEVLKALEHCQLALGRVLAENRSLRQTNSDLLAAASSKRHRLVQGDNKLGYKSQIGTLAKRFFFTQEAWVQTTDFRKDRPEPPLNPEHRFTNDNVYSQSVTTALFDNIPPKYYPLLDYNSYKHFAADFITEFGNAHASVINSIRRVMPIILASAGYSVEMIEAKIKSSSLSYASHKTKHLVSFPPVIFPNGSKNMNCIFLSRIVLDVHRAMCHGPSSLGDNAKPDPKASATKYGIFEATDHSIAFAAIAARFVLSPDKTWASTGTISNIKWEYNYRIYRKLLASNRDSPVGRNIFKTFNRHVFAGVPLPMANMEADSDGDQDVEDEISAAMHRLAFGTLDDTDAQPDNSVMDGAINNLGIDECGEAHFAPTPPVLTGVLDRAATAGSSHTPPYIPSATNSDVHPNQQELVEIEGPRRSGRRAGQGSKRKGTS
ncbi:hypothetical protein B0H10DRAFT_2374846 [Mycena sp. CBHHK59/15]|nr:hypothetical protein B0H10DRAFT_2374846 [Mycena sp. CBHHK59/15]